MKKIVRAELAAFFLPLFLTQSMSGTAADWPQWRGPNRSDVSTETGLLKEWPAGRPSRLWLFNKVGNEYSGSAIAGEKLFTLGTRDRAEVLIALICISGEELWTASVGRILETGKADGPAGPPTVHGERAYDWSGLGN